MICLHVVTTVKDDNEIRCILSAAVANMADAKERGLQGADRVLEVIPK